MSGLAAESGSEPKPELLCIAASEGNDAVAKLLIDGGADMNQADEEG
eukprot:COSAG02_NODE_20226_length_842_cov_1.090175_1_plen_46_part_10